MLIIGVDSHKKTLTAAAIDSMGREQGTILVAASAKGRAELLSWAERVRGAAPVTWGIEGSGTYGRTLAQELCASGSPVYEVPGTATARERRAAVGVQRQKTDTSDALAVARITAREGERLPRVYTAGIPHRCKLLSEHRDNLVLQRTRLMNQLHAQVSALDEPPSLAISATRGRHLLEKWVRRPGCSTDPLQLLHQQIIRQLARLILIYDEMARAVADELAKLVKEAAPELVELRGSGALTAARILGETGDIQRFDSASRFASYCGVAPIQASSGERVRHRLSRRGNRQLNYSLHTIAVTQRRWDERAKAFLERKIAEGKSRKEALRCLKRHLANVVYRILRDAAQPTRLSAAA